MTRRVSFPFRRQLTPFGFTWVPIVPVELRHLGSTLIVDMIVDSGAEISMIPLRVGRAIGFRPRSRESGADLGGIAAAVPFLMRRIRMQIGHFRWSARIAWAQRQDVPLLLGRMDVFDRFDIRFSMRRNRLTVSR